MLGTDWEGTEEQERLSTGVRVFYKSVVQAVLLFGSESWVLTPVLLKRLEGFHIWYVYQMARTHRQKCGSTNSWA